MKLGSDAVLFGGWIDYTKASSILDIGTGAGILSLIAAQRNHKAHIHAIEIDPQASIDAHKNFEQSPFSDRLSLIEQDFRTYESTNKYDLIICNPPFFSNSLLPPNNQRAVARHTNSLHWKDLLAKAPSLLSDSGQLNIMIPGTELEDVQKFESELALSQLCLVKSLEDSPVNRLFIRHTHSSAEIEYSELVVHTPTREKTEAFKRQTRDLYLSF